METNCPHEEGGEGEECRSCTPLPPEPPNNTMVEVEDGVEICPPPPGVIDELSNDFNLDEMSLQRKEERLPFQIFQGSVEVVLGPEGSLIMPEKERLPSIMVEPSDVSEVESGELRWPPEDMDFEEDEDLFLEQCIPPANIADWGVEEEEVVGQGEEQGVIILTNQNTTLLDLQSDLFRDETPTLPPESAPSRGP